MRIAAVFASQRRRGADVVPPLDLKGRQHFVARQGEDVAEGAFQVEGPLLVELLVVQALLSKAGALVAQLSKLRGWQGGNPGEQESSLAAWKQPTVDPNRAPAQALTLP